MNAWTGQVAPCVFCEIRAIFKCRLIRINPRKLHTSSSLFRDRHLERATEDRGGELRIRGNNRRAQARRNHFERNGNYIPKAAPGSSEYDRGLGESALNNLGPLRERLRRGRATDDSKLSQYESLDPDQNHWPAFEEKLRSLVRQHKAGQ